MNGFANNAEIYHWARLLSVNPPPRFNRKNTGQAVSAVPGDGFDFRDIREYQDGDDARHIAWSATARRGELFVKTFYEDRTPEVWIVVDTSAQIGFASARPTKYDVLSAAAAVLFSAFGLMERGTNLLFFHAEKNSVEHIRLRPGRRNIFAGFHELALRRPETGGDSYPQSFGDGDGGNGGGMLRLFQSLAVHIRKPSLVFILSDFWHDLPWQLWESMDLRHALYPIRITDPFELLLWERPDSAAHLHFGDGLQGAFPRLLERRRESVEFIASRPRCFNRPSTGFAFSDFIAFLQERNR